MALALRLSLNLLAGVLAGLASPSDTWQAAGGAFWETPGATGFWELPS